MTSPGIRVRTVLRAVSIVALAGTWAACSPDASPTADQTPNADDASGQDATGDDASGRDAASQDAASRDATELDAVSLDGSGRDASEEDVVAHDASNQDATGEEAAVGTDAEADAGADALRAQDAQPDASGDATTTGPPDASDASSAEGGSSTCPVPGTYAISLVGTQCTTTNPGTGSPCVASATPDDNVAQVMLGFDPSAGWTATPVNGLIANPTALTATATGFSGQSSVTNVAEQCNATFAIDCQADTIAITDSCITRTGTGCGTNSSSTVCSPNGTVTNQFGGIEGSFGQSGSASLSDAGIGDGG